MSGTPFTNVAGSARKASMRRGHTSVEYAILTAVVILLSGTFAVIGNEAFASVHNGVTEIYGSQTSSPPSKEATTTYSIVALTPLKSYFLLTMSLVSIASICFIGKSMRTKSKPSQRTNETTSEQAPSIKVDGSAKLRDMIYEKRDVMLTEMQEDLGHVLNGRFEVSNLMSTKMKVVTPELSAADVRRVMAKHKMHHLLVCNGSQLVGVISDRDLTRTPNARRAAGMMTRNPISVQPDNCLIPTVSTMINKRISCLPVTEDGELKGVLTRTDLLVAFQCFLQIMSKLVHETEGDAVELNADVAAAK